MKPQRRNGILISLVLSLVLVVVGPVRLSKEFSYTAEFAFPLEDGGDGDFNGETAVPLRIMDRLAYINSNGAYRVFPVSHEAAAGKQGFLAWRAEGILGLLRDSGGTILASFEGVGAYPVVEPSGIGLVQRSLTGFSWYGTKGEFKWSWTGFAPLVDIRSGPGNLVTSLDLDGVVRLHGNDGQVTATWSPPPGERVGLALVINRENELSVVCGTKPQRLYRLAYEDTAPELRVRSSVTLGSSFHRDIVLESIDMGELTVVEQDGGILLVDGQGRTRRFLQVTGRLDHLVEEEGYRLVILARTAPDGTYLDLITTEGTVLGILGPGQPVLDAAAHGDGVVTLAGPEGIVGLRFGFL